MIYKILYLFLTIICLSISISFFIKKKSPLKEKSIVVFVVNNSINMSTGKIISQLAHAFSKIAHQVSDTRLQVDIYRGNTLEIKNLCAEAHKYNIKYSKIHDAGRTQVPSGSNTILIIGPYSDSRLLFSGLKKLVDL